MPRGDFKVGKKQLSVWIDETVRDRLAAFVTAEDLFLNDAVERAVSSYLTNRARWARARQPKPPTTEATP